MILVKKKKFFPLLIVLENKPEKILNNIVDKKEAFSD